MTSDLSDLRRAPARAGTARSVADGAPARDAIDLDPDQRAHLEPVIGVLRVLRAERLDGAGVTGRSRIDHGARPMQRTQASLVQSSSQRSTRIATPGRASMSRTRASAPGSSVRFGFSSIGVHRTGATGSRTKQIGTGRGVPSGPIVTSVAVRAASGRRVAPGRSLSGSAAARPWWSCSYTPRHAVPLRRSCRDDRARGRLRRRRGQREPDGDPDRRPVAGAALCADRCSVRDRD